MEVSSRLTAWINRTFAAGDAERVLELLQGLPPAKYGRQDPERIQASVVIATDGDWSDFEGRLKLLQRDWRDALVAGGLGHGDWPRRLDAALGTDS